MGTGTQTDPFLASDLTITAITNLYLYGTTESQAGYGAGARTATEIANLPIESGVHYYNVYTDTSSYMITGAGRYAYADVEIMQMGKSWLFLRS